MEPSIRIPIPLSHGVTSAEAEQDLTAVRLYDAARFDALHGCVEGRDPECLIHDGIRRAGGRWSLIDWRCSIWHYYRCVEEVDRHFGLVLDALEPLLAKENAVVLFASDRGGGVGRHQMFQKFTLVTVASEIDIFATVCDHAGVEPPEGTVNVVERPAYRATTDARPDRRLDDSATPRLTSRTSRASVSRNHECPSIAGRRQRAIPRSVQR